MGVDELGDVESNHMLLNVAFLGILSYLKTHEDRFHCSVFWLHLIGNIDFGYLWNQKGSIFIICTFNLFNSQSSRLKPLDYLLRG